MANQTLSMDMLDKKEIVPVGLILDLVPKTEPRMIAPMIRVVNKHIGMTTLFLPYQGRLVNIMENPIKDTVRKI
jgi:hypothetical protein